MWGVGCEGVGVAELVCGCRYVCDTIAPAIILYPCELPKYKATYGDI